MTFPFTIGISIAVVGIAYLTTRRQPRTEH